MAISYTKNRLWFHFISKINISFSYSSPIAPKYLTIGVHCKTSVLMTSKLRLLIGHNSLIIYSPTGNAITRDLNIIDNENLHSNKSFFKAPKTSKLFGFPVWAVWFNCFQRLLNYLAFQSFD